MVKLDNKNTEKMSLYTWVMNNLVTLIFLAFTLFGFLVAEGVSADYFLTEITSRLYRNGILVLSLIIPVLAGLGLNFGIVIGAMAGQIAIAIVRFFDMGGLGGLALTFIISAPLAAIFGYFTGILYNKTRGQEMIASLIVGFFANGLYQFLFLFVVGAIIPVPKGHPMIMPNGIGIRMSIDMGTLKYSLENILEVPFMWGVLVVAGVMLVVMLLKRFNVIKAKKGSKRQVGIMPWVNMGLCAVLVVISIHAIVTNSNLMLVKKIPIGTVVIILLVCLFTELIMKTKLGQDFRSVGQNQHIAEVSGINVDRTRIIATIISTVLASWGMIIYLQNMGTLSTYSAHTNIGMFAVASLLVGGASLSKAGIKNAIVGAVLFNAMFIMSPAIGQAVFGQALLGEYFRTFMMYGVIGVALGIYVWKNNKQSKTTL